MLLLRDVPLRHARVSLTSMMTTDHAACRAEAALLKAEALDMAEALHTIVQESCDPDSVRLALSGLQGTNTGRDYLTANPIGR